MQTITHRFDVVNNRPYTETDPDKGKQALEQALKSILVAASDLSTALHIIDDTLTDAQSLKIQAMIKDIHSRHAALLDILNK